MTIVTVPEGNFTPGALATLQFSANVINATWDLANAKYDTYEQKITAITDAATGWLSTLAAPTTSSPATARRCATTGKAAACATASARQPKPAARLPMPPCTMPMCRAGC